MKLYDHLLSNKKKMKRDGDFDILRKIRVTLPAQLPEAQSAALLGPVLGQYGINVSLFSKQFSEKTKHYDAEVMVNVLITLYKNKTFFVEVKTPPIAFLIYELQNSKFLMETGTQTQFLSLDNQLQYNYPSLIKLKELLQLFKFLNLIDPISNKNVLFRSLLGSLKSMKITFDQKLSKKTLV